MMSSVFDCVVVSAKGRSNIYNEYKRNVGKYFLIYVIADGAAFGSCVGRFEQLQENGKSLFIFLPESFEYMLLCTSIVRRFIDDSRLGATYDYCDSVDFLSWEQYYTSLLKGVCSEQLHTNYFKSKLPELFKREGLKEEIKGMLKDIDWS